MVLAPQRKACHISASYHLVVKYLPYSLCRYYKKKKLIRQAAANDRAMKRM